MSLTVPKEIQTDKEFYLRYYAGHKGKFGHEFIEFDIRSSEDGKYGILRYTNNSNYRREDRIKKEVTISAAVVDLLRKIVQETEIMKENDSKWPPKNRDGKQELEIRAGRYHISFETTKIGSLNDVKKSEDPDGLRVFYYFVQDVKALIFSLVSLHFKVKPI